MPRTAWTFIIGGLALSGFPFVTAGFWSKDEILADAWAHNQLVFVILAVAALLTAFYTARQIVMTFFGKPRTAAAEHASEHDSIFQWMTIPLMVLAFFAVGLRLGRHPDDVPGAGRAFAATCSTIMSAAWPRRCTSKPRCCTSTAMPLVTSLVVALGGLLLGWLTYRGVARIGNEGRRSRCNSVIRWRDRSAGSTRSCRTSTTSMSSTARCS